MTTNYDYQILQIEDLEAILNYENQKLQQQIQDEAERELASWTKPWRRESLEHYLPLGWSFAAWQKVPDQGRRLKGYFIAQPQTFVRGLTQTLWIEHISWDKDDAQIKEALLEIAYRMSREKHFQLLVAPQFSLADGFSLAAVHELDQDYMAIKTARFS